MEPDALYCRSGKVKLGGQVESARINRHKLGDTRALHRRSTNHCGPESCAVRWPWTNESQSLTQHIARTLSKALNEQQLPSVENGSISHDFIEEMKSKGNTSLSTLIIPVFDFSIYIG